MLPQWKTWAVCIDAHDDYNYNDSEEHIFHKIGGNNLSKHLVLLDNQSTFDQFVNASYLTNIHSVTTPIMVYCNAFSTSTKQKGVFGKFPVWSNPNGIANVLSLKTITDHYLVTYNSKDRIESVLSTHQEEQLNLLNIHKNFTTWTSKQCYMQIL